MPGVFLLEVFDANINTSRDVLRRLDVLNCTIAKIPQRRMAG